jgi:esterase/lipase superfamily enzyme
MSATAIAKTTVLFATSRQQAAKNVGGFPSFTNMALAPASLICASATVDKLKIDAPARGKIVDMTDLHTGGFAPDEIETLTKSENDVLVFVHGAANSFEDSVVRGAYNKAWLGAASEHGLSSDFDVIVFSWPSWPYTYWFLPSDLTGYRSDQSEATASAAHFGLFLKLMSDLRKYIGSRRMSLLCHSMGNYMLGTAVETWSGANPAVTTPLFDYVLLAAADEIANTFSTPNNGRLDNLKKLGRKITAYYNYDDVLMKFSHIANCDIRLGYDGPPNAADLNFFPADIYDFVDCTGVTDYISAWTDQPDRSHQYYRQSPTVRLDIAQVLAGLKPQRLRYDPRSNSYGLFPPA